MMYRMQVPIISVFLMSLLSGIVSAENAPYNNYYDNPVHYTSYVRSIYNVSAVNVANETTDAFSGTFSFPQDRNVGTVKFNDQIMNFLEISRKSYEQLFGTEENLSISTRFYLSDCYSNDCDPYLVVVSPNSMTLLVKVIQSDDSFHVFGFRPTRYMICKKILEAQQQQNTQMFTQLFKTLLLAGVQSYTGYQTYQGSGNVYGNNGHFGYSESGVYRDYSWAGARAADALDTLFSGSANASDLNRAWTSLNCF